MKHEAIVRLTRRWSDGKRTFTRGEVVALDLETAGSILIAGAGRVLETRPVGDRLGILNESPAESTSGQLEASRA